MLTVKHKESKLLKHFILNWNLSTKSVKPKEIYWSSNGSIKKQCIYFFILCVPIWILLKARKVNAVFQAPKADKFSVYECQLDHLLFIISIQYQINFYLVICIVLYLYCVCIVDLSCNCIACFFINKISKLETTMFIHTNARTLITLSAVDNVSAHYSVFILQN